jgi:alginate O-acetyltransferase complex protein AlgI
LFHGAFLLFEEYAGVLKKLPKLLMRIYTLLVVCVGFVIFRADDISQGLMMIRNMFSGFSMSDSSLSLALTQLTPWFIFAFAAAVIISAPIKPLTEKLRLKLDASAAVSGRLMILQTVLYILAAILLFWCILRLSGDAYNPFIYFRF